MTIWGPGATAVTGTVYGPEEEEAGEKCSRTLTIHFTVGSGGENVVLAWGAHIARGPGFNGWGPGQGATAINGAPYHVSLESLDGAPTGRQSVGLQAGEGGTITPASTITLIKRAGGGDGTFGYRLTGGGGLEPELKITTVNGEGSASEPGIIPGDYEIKESSLPLDWFFEALTCTTTGGATATPVGSTAKIRIPITGGATVTCTYTNLLPSTPLPEGEPRIETTATSTMLGGTIKDAALISGLHEPTGEGTLTFHLYSDERCEDPVPGFSSVIDGVTEDKEFESAAFTPNKLGKYFWRAVFSGDTNNLPAESFCNVFGEISEVTQAQPAIRTFATESVRVGGPIQDTAEITGLVKPSGTGTITFHLYSDEDCTVPVPGFSSVIPEVKEDGTYSSAVFTSVNAGLYYWIAEFSGDENNEPVKTEC
jgi:hypothetical protein